MASKTGGGCFLLAVVIAVGAFAFSKADGSSAPPAVPDSITGDGTGRYVALGDSYTSAPKTGGQAGTPAGCDRSDNNYPHLVAAKLKPAEFIDVSCSGATTANMASSQQTKNGSNPAQLNAVNKATTLVTVGIGGNDVGFIELARQCATIHQESSPCKDKLTAGGKDELAMRIDDTAKKVGALLDKIHAKAPKARIIVVGYPSILPAGNGCWPSLPFGAPDVAYFHDGISKFNDALAEQARTHKAGFADTESSSTGHDVCTAADTRWVEGILPASPAAALHPNARGEQGIADTVSKLLK